MISPAPGSAAAAQEALQSHVARREALVRQIREGSGEVRLTKRTSNLFRLREPAAGRRLDVRQFNRVLRIDAATRTAVVEGMTTFEDLVDATLDHDLLPPVVPELKTITIGGAVTGIGIESSSFRWGFVHESVLEMDVLLGDGSVVTCTPDNEHRDLFFAIPNSYGTLGYILRLVIPLVPAKPFVALTHSTFRDPAAFFDALREACVQSRANPGTGFDFIDGSVFAEDELVLTCARFVDHAPAPSDYTYMRRYHRSVRRGGEDHLTAHDYIWRWDADWFWCSSNFGMENDLLRLVLGPVMLRSSRYWKIMNTWRKLGMAKVLARLRIAPPPKEPVIQDVEVPIERAAEFLAFFHREIGIKPVWICPVQPFRSEARWPLYDMDPDRIYVNFGFWDNVPVKTPPEDGVLNRKIEAKVLGLGGRKSLYSTSFYDRDTFWTIYDGSAYRAAKARYDASGRLRDLYDKCVLRH